ncbi:MAG: LysE family transporter [bacterium]|nr:LysE family transporter [Candidatus Sumerlaeota bacterium]
MLTLFILGIIVGIGAAAAPGPINLEIVRRAVARGPRIALSFSLGTLSGDLIYLTAASMGATALVINLPPMGKAVMFFIGAALLMVMAVRIFLVYVKGGKTAAPNGIDADVAESETPALTATTMARSYIIGLALTLSSPTTIAYWLTVSIYAAQQAPHMGKDFSVTAPLVAGVAISCVLWVSTVVTLASLFHKRISPRATRIIEMIVGSGLVIFSFIALYNGIRLLVG